VLARSSKESKDSLETDSTFIYFLHKWISQ
jgi:hypothetical protein